MPRWTSGALVVVAALAVTGPRSAAADAQHGLLSGYMMTSWTLSEGIPVGPVYAMAQDHEGYLWLGIDGRGRALRRHPIHSMGRHPSNAAATR